MTRSVQVALAWLACAASCTAQQARPESRPLRDGTQVRTLQHVGSESRPPTDGTKSRAFSGRVVDGLGRPVPGVKITVQSHRKRGAKTLEKVLRTGNDGGFAGTLAPGD